MMTFSVVRGALTLVQGAHKAMRTVPSPIVLMLAFALIGCEPKWVVVRHATPNPMTPGSSFRVEKAAFDPKLRVGKKTEEEWIGEMSDKHPGHKERWDADKVAMSQDFVDGFMGEKGNLLVANTPGAGVFSVRATYVHYDPGFYAVVAGYPTTVDADIELLDPASVVVDVIHIRVAWATTSSGGGAHHCAAEVGAVAAKYLKKRVGLQ